MLFNVIVLILTACAFALEELLPAVPLAQNARLFVAPVFFFCVAVAVPFPMMLLLAFITGFVWDARYMQMVSVDAGAEQFANVSVATGAGSALSGSSSLGFGSSIIMFALLGCLMQGIRPMFRKGRWELPVLMTGLVTVFWLVAQYLLLTFLRGDVVFSQRLGIKLVSDALMAMLASPLIYLCLHTLAGATNYEIKYEGLRYRFDGR
jgi:hypothetical protein